jgi:diguanylate cyclase (GGDEF)-like protein
METPTTRVTPSLAGPGGLAPVRMAADVAAVWERHKEGTIERLRNLERAAAALVDGVLDNGQRRQAEAEAHNLAGSVGVFGFSEGSRLAREIEGLLRGSAPLPLAEVMLVSELVVGLRRHIERPIEVSPDPAEEESFPKPSIAVVSGDRDLADRVTVLAVGRGAQVMAFSNLADAGAAFVTTRPDFVVLDLSPPVGVAAGLRFLTELSVGRAAVPVLVLADDASETDRIEVVRLGGREFLRKPASAQQVVAAATQILERRRAPWWTVLVIGDDARSKSVKRLLSPRHLNIVALSDPSSFWDTLETVSPDLVIFDEDMPGALGIGLTKAVRGSSKWAALPVMFLSAQDRPDAIRNAFTAGADDFIRTPVSGVDLAARIIGRIGRGQGPTTAGRMDALTGAADHKSGRAAGTRLVQMAGRHGQSVCVAVIAIDDADGLVQRYGRMAANIVLRRAGATLLSTFRGDDVVCRWSEDAFLVAMYGMEHANGVHRLAGVLERLRQERFTTGQGSFSAAISVGVAQFPTDGPDLDALARAAQFALARAETFGPSA